MKCNKCNSENLKVLGDGLHKPTIVCSDCHAAGKEVTMSRSKGTNKHMRIKVQAELVTTAAKFINELGMPEDLTDVVFDYSQQRIEIFDSHGGYVSGRSFTG